MTSEEPTRSANADALRAGDVLGNYQLLCPVARGGMGQVWAARRTGRLGLPQVVAVKTALPGCEPNHERLEKLFLDEARVAASIDHPNVCRILDLGEDQGVLYLAMEWIDGASLSAVLSRLPRPRRLPYALAARIVAEACAGLHAAHELRDEEGVPLDVVHRDATPQNILLSARGDVKVVDFGVVKSRDQVHQATVAGEVKGKISYLSPEQLLGHTVDRRTDIFALGNVLYYATTGQRPFTAETTATTLMRIMSGQYALPSTIAPDYPEDLERIVARALAHEPAERFATAEEMRLALETYLARRPTVGAADLAAVLRRHLGQEITARRDEIRAAQKLFDAQSATPGSALAASTQAEVDALQPAAETVEPTPAPTTPIGTLSPLTGGCEPAAQPPRSLARSRRALLGSAGLAAAIAVAAGIWLQGPRSAVAGAPMPGDSRPAAGQALGGAHTAIPGAGGSAVPFETVELSVRVLPDGATLSIDDGPPMATPITLVVRRDGKSHTLRVRAPRHAERVETLVFDRAQTLSLELRPSRTTARAPVGLALASPAERQIATAPRPVVEAPKPDGEFDLAARRPRPRRTIDEGDPFQ